MTFLVSLPAPFLTSHTHTHAHTHTHPYTHTHTHTHTLATYIGGANSEWFKLVWELQVLLLWLQSPFPHGDRGMER